MWSLHFSRGLILVSCLWHFGEMLENTRLLMSRCMRFDQSYIKPLFMYLELRLRSERYSESILKTLSNS
jgi:hypothetical protein